MNRKKVIVIGAGPGGLSAGLLLAHHGLDVHIYEKNDSVGGRNAALKSGEYVFDLGPTFFLMKEVLESVFLRTGRSLSDYADLREIDPMYRLHFSEEMVFYSTRDPERMKAELERVFPGSHDGYLRYMKKERKKYEKLIPCLAMPYSSLKSFLSWQLISSIPYLDLHKSVFGVLGRYFSDDHLKSVFSFQAKYLGMSPWEAPGLFSILAFIEHGGGIYHVTGGLSQLSVAMARAFEEEGGAMHLSTPVREVLIENGRAVGVLLEDGSEQRADDVVINADFAHAMKQLVDGRHRKKYTDDALARKKYSCSTFMLYLGVNRVYDKLAHHSIIFADDYKANITDITKLGVLSEQPSFYVQNPVVTDQTLAPEGKSTLYVLVPVPNNSSGIDWKKEAGPLRDKILDCMEQRGGYDDLRSHIEVERIITPQDWQDDANVYEGAVFNLGHQLSQMLMLRPHNEFEEFDNCYLVGGGTHPGSGLPTIYQSALISSSLLLKKYGIQMKTG
jgi:phytoene desaturase